MFRVARSRIPESRCCLLFHGMSRRDAELKSNPIWAGNERGECGPSCCWETRISENFRDPDPIVKAFSSNESYHSSWHTRLFSISPLYLISAWRLKRLWFVKNTILCGRASNGILKIGAHYIRLLALRIALLVAMSVLLVD